MRYSRTHSNFRQYKPKDSWFSFKKRRSRRHRFVIEKTEAAVWPLLASKTKRGTAVNSHYKRYLLAACGLVWLGLLLFLPFFRITKVEYYGLKIIQPAEIENAVNSIIPPNAPWWRLNNNYFLTNTSLVEKTLNKTFALSSVQVKKIFPNILQISLIEKTSSFIYDNGDSYWLLDKNGLAIKYLKAVEENEYTRVLPPTTTAAAPAVSGNLSGAVNASSSFYLAASHRPDYKALHDSYGNYPIILDSHKTDLIEKETKILTPGYLQGLMSISEGLALGSAVRINYFAVLESGAGVAAYSDKIEKLFFQPNKDIESQINNLKIILRNSRPKEYVDLRFGDRVYWK